VSIGIQIMMLFKEHVASFSKVSRPTLEDNSFLAILLAITNNFV